jgi:predicted Zn-dependent protease
VVALADESTLTQRFQRAREAFLEGDYGKAQYRIEEMIRTWPDDPVLREFRALVLFARRNYDEAAPELAAVLTSGPGWDWQTLSSFYPSTEVYDGQLRTLEQFVRDNPDSGAGHFVLAYQYLCLDERAAAQSQMEEVLRLKPDDSVAARLLKMLQAAGTSQPAPVQPAAPVNPGPK